MRISDWSSDVCSSDLTGQHDSRLKRLGKVRADAPSVASAALLVGSTATFSDKLTIAVLGHPACAGEMCVMDAPGSLRFAVGVETEQDRDGLPPIGTVGFCIEQAEVGRSEEHTSELQSLMRISYAVFCLNKKKT